MLNRTFNREVFERTLPRHPVETAYLFGSQTRGETGPLSDVDIGVYFNSDTQPQERFDRRLRLIGEISKGLNTDSIDLVVLNSAPLSLQFRAIKEGEILFCRDELSRIRREARVMSLYYDDQYYARRHARLTIGRIAREGIL